MSKIASYAAVAGSAGTPSGTHAARPAASARANVVYFETDTGRAFFSDGTNWTQIAPGTADAALAMASALHGYTLMAIDSATANAAFAPTAGLVYLSKVMTPPWPVTISQLDCQVITAGTGVTPLANCFVGIYDSGGTRRYVSADQSTPWATNNTKSVTGIAYTPTPSDYIYVALLVGTQSTTNVTFAVCAAISSIVMSFGLAAAAYRGATNVGSQTSLPSSLTLSSNAVSSRSFLVGMK